MSLRRRIGLIVSFLLALGSANSLNVASAAPLVLDLGGGVTMELLPIKHGTYTEGSPADEQGRAENETARKVTLTHDFYLGKTPVTVGQFKRFVTATGYRTEAEIGVSGGYGFDGRDLVQRKEFTWKNPGFPQTDHHPVVIVTYVDATSFAHWVSTKTRYRATLPTEAQWEYACRAGTTTRYYFGDSDADLKNYAWYKADSAGGTHPVATKKPNEFGLYDMSGNVFEWCRDWAVPRTATAATDPEARDPGSSSPARRVLRGGSWFRDPKHLRSAARFESTPGTRRAENGFRLVVDADSSGAALHTGAATVGGGAGVPTQRHGEHAAPLESHEQAESSPALSGSTKVVIGIAAILLIGALILLARFLGASSEGEWNPQQNANMATGAALGAAGVGRQPNNQYFTQADDGFWFDRFDISPGTLLQVAYLLNGLRHQQRVTTERGTRQFVYTGGRPENIEIVSADTPNDDPYLANDPSPYRVDTTEPIRPTESDSSFRGFPSAY